MLATIALITLVSILVAISALHVYWAFGGKFASKDVFPVLEGSKQFPQPPFIATLIVAVLLLVAAGLFLWHAGVFTPHLPEWLRQVGVWTVTIIFLLRAIGEFRYVGFFKTVRDTGFGRKDTMIYSPLCLFIAVLGFIVITRLSLLDR